MFKHVLRLSRDLDCLGAKNRALVTLPVEEVLQTLNDLITYFQLPDAELEHEERQIKLRSLKNRQNLFKQEVSFSKGSINDLLSPLQGNDDFSPRMQTDEPRAEADEREEK